MDPSSKTWFVDGADTKVLAQAPTLNIDSKTGNWIINGTDSGVSGLGHIGPQGAPGQSALTFKVGTVSNGTNAAVTNSGDDANVVLDFVVPVGEAGKDGNDGVSPTIKVGNVTTDGATTTVTNRGTESAAVLDFNFPLGSYVTSDGLTNTLSGYVAKSALTSYYTSAQMDTKLSAKADLTMIANIADKDTVQTLSNKVDQLNAQVNSQAQTMIKLQDQINTVLAKLKTTTTTTA
ncbi:hypothetical protein EQG56_00320 [Limosilactobacillus fermentum]|nr:hypothetical protein DB329_05350 [Limosilactobacillus fermentum]QAR24767.1 hypothetical protein EQG56_00055 [Limosilactobacillus fermentum]QAR24772.1 hypothetical protein EQG56_00320 [Limosilactobacillus fermentum]